MIDSRASRAPTSPPETGASTLCTPIFLAASAISTASDGSLVVMSTSDRARRLPASAPSGPRITVRTSAGKPTMVKTTSDSSATALGESAQRRRARQQGLGLVARAVVDRGREAGGDQVPAHARAHHAGADPADASFAGGESHKRLQAVG